MKSKLKYKFNTVNKISEVIVKNIYSNFLGIL